MALRNTGQFAAINARITSVTGVVTTAGTGTVTLQPVGFPIGLGNLAPNAVASTKLNFTWPATATRIQFTVHFAAHGGYSGSTTLNVLR